MLIYIKTLKRGPGSLGEFRKVNSLHFYNFIYIYIYTAAGICSGLSMAPSSNKT